MLLHYLSSQLFFPYSLLYFCLSLISRHLCLSSLQFSNKQNYRMLLRNHPCEVELSSKIIPPGMNQAQWLQKYPYLFSSAYPTTYHDTSPSPPSPPPICIDIFFHKM